MIALLAFAPMDRIGRKHPFRAYVREWREHLGLSQEQVAARIGCSVGTISKKEKNPERVDGQWGKIIADALNIEDSRLWQPPPPPIERQSPRDRLRNAVEDVPEDRAEEAAQLLRVITGKRA